MKEFIRAIKTAMLMSGLPEPFRAWAIKQNEINNKMVVAFNQLKKRVGKEKAEELLIKFSNEAYAGREVNHEYIIRKINSYKQ